MDLYATNFYLSTIRLVCFVFILFILVAHRNSFACLRLCDKIYGRISIAQWAMSLHSTISSLSLFFFFFFLRLHHLGALHTDFLKFFIEKVLSVSCIFIFLLHFWSSPNNVDKCVCTVRLLPCL